jgi:putative nucleotidyltransferase with HDIG domain
MANESIKKFSIPLVAYFVTAIILIAISFPREGKFKYNFIQGKPWKYGLLTAPFDVTIYKTDAEVQAEKDSIENFNKPFYFSIDKTVLDKALHEISKNAEARQKRIPEAYLDYLKKQLDYIYAAGIISSVDFERIEKTESQELRIKTNNMAVARQLNSFFTIRSAYEWIVKNCPSHLNVNELKQLDINNYIQSNVVYNKELSAKALEEYLSKVMISLGVVQMGEKIIDRGEIVDAQSYRILLSLQKQTQSRIGSRQYQAMLLLGEIILISVFVFAFFSYLYLYRPREFYNKKNAVFMLLQIAIFCIITGFFSTDKGFFNVYIIPFVIPTIMIRTFIDSRTAMVTHIVTTMICSLMVPFPSEFILLQIVAGFVGIFSLKDLTERSQLIRSSFFVLIAYVLVYLGIVLIQEGDVTKVYWRMFVYFGINFVFLTFTYFLVYFCEKTFGFISGVSMVELSNINKPLLQELSEVAPGTFQHSLQVSNLAASAALKIGANASLVRTGALYHDIGKMLNPAYFTENQTPGFNPHTSLSCMESAQIIISHVKDGVKLAKKHNIPKQIIDFIETHHGTGKAKFFYNSYKNEHPDEEIDESVFYYPGPNPFSKETAILMMADAVEAASRSLPEYTDESISRLVNSLIEGQLQDGLLRKAPITFQDVEIVKSVFCDKLKTIYHSRISYPELQKKDNLAPAQPI